MKRIGNDPSSYVKRSDIGPRQLYRQKDACTPKDKQREKEYLIAPIDNGGYIDFNIPTKPREGARGSEKVARDRRR